jgi:hypothetical protein
LNQLLAMAAAEKTGGTKDEMTRAERRKVLDDLTGAFVSSVRR